MRNFLVQLAHAGHASPELRERLDQQMLGHLFFLQGGSFFGVRLIFYSHKLGQIRIAKAFGEGHISQKLAEEIGRVYSSSTFGRSEGYSGETRLHKRVAQAGNLALNCDVDTCDIPIRVQQGGASVVQIVPWPLILPHKFASALVEQGRLSMLLGDRSVRDRFWHVSKDQYPELAAVDSRTSAPICLYGDEATIFRQSVMAIHWCASLNPSISNSAASRFLICILPSEHYFAPWLAGPFCLIACVVWCAILLQYHLRWILV